MSKIESSLGKIDFSLDRLDWLAGEFGISKQGIRARKQDIEILKETKSVIDRARETLVRQTSR